MRFVICTTPDWTAVYADGELLVEGHHVDAVDLLEELAEEAIPFTVEEVERKRVTQHRIDTLGGYFPDLLEDLLCKPI
jgi:hypothetical protein